MTDEVGNEIKVGDTWVATCVNSSRGVGHWLFQSRCTVVALSRSRIVIDTAGASVSGTTAVGAECGKIVAAVDGRPLRGWADVHAERAAARMAERAI